MLKITARGKPRRLKSELSLLDLLKEMKLDKRLLLIRVNGNIIQKPNWAETRIHNKDSIDIEHVIHAGG